MTPRIRTTEQARALRRGIIQARHRWALSGDYPLTLHGGLDFDAYLTTLYRLSTPPNRRNRAR